MKVQLSKKAQKDLDRIPEPYYSHISTKIKELLERNKSLDIKKLTNLEEYRLRVGNYRVLYLIEEDTIIVARILPRGSAY